MFENEEIITQLKSISISLRRIADRLDSWDNYTNPSSLHHLKTNK